MASGWSGKVEDDLPRDIALSTCTSEAALSLYSVSRAYSLGSRY